GFRTNLVPCLAVVSDRKREAQLTERSRQFLGCVSMLRRNAEITHCPKGLDSGERLLFSRILELQIGRRRESVEALPLRDVGQRGAWSCPDEAGESFAHGPGQ